MAINRLFLECARTFGLPFALVWAVGDYVNAYELSARGFTDWGVVGVLARALVAGFTLGMGVGYVWKHYNP